MLMALICLLLRLWFASCHPVYHLGNPRKIKGSSVGPSIRWEINGRSEGLAREKENAAQSGVATAVSGKGKAIVGVASGGGSEGEASA
jgi:hypothetical protein